MAKVVGQELPAMAFYHGDGLVPAWNQATEFAGPKGRIATMPDIIAARMATKPSDTPWEKYYTTTSAEYVGHSRGGNKILIVAHGVGPMSTLDGILKAYSHEYNDKTRCNRGGRISHEEFLRLESGEYGEVAIVDFDRYLVRSAYPFIETLSNRDAQSDPLLHARFGQNAGQYLAYHTRHAREWHKEQAGLDPENRHNLPGHDKFCDRRRVMHGIKSEQGSNPYIITINEAANCSYEHCPLKEDEAFAHLLSIGRLMHLRHDQHESLVCDVSAHEWWNGVRFVGIREGTELSHIHPGFGFMRDIVFRHWETLARPARNHRVPAMVALAEGPGRQWFTQYPKRGASMDTYDPEFPVISREPIGETVILKTEIGGYHMFVRYAMQEVMALAPVGANAYTTGEAEIIWTDGNPTHHTIPIQFYRAKIDGSRRLPRPVQLKNNYRLLMSLL